MFLKIIIWICLFYLQIAVSKPISTMAAWTWRLLASRVFRGKGRRLIQREVISQRVPQPWLRIIAEVQILQISCGVMWRVISIMNRVLLICVKLVERRIVLNMMICMKLYIYKYTAHRKTRDFNEEQMVWNILYTYTHTKV